MILLKHFFLIGSLVFAVATVSGCKSEKAPKAPEKKDSLDAEDKKDLSEEGETESEDPTDTPAFETPESTDPLSLEVESATALKVKVGTPAAVTFNIKGAGGKDVLVGLMAAPSGATVETSGSTVTFKWQSPTGGTYPLKFLLRDKKKCEDEASASKCKITGSETNLTAKSYDTASQEFSLEVGTEDNLGLPGNNGGGAGNDQLIQQIVALLGGGGGAGIQDLLKTLSNGQLQNLLGQLQNGGGGGGIGQLISLIGNL